MTKVNPAFKPEKMYNYTPVYSGVDALAPDEFADSGNIVCIKTSESMLPYLITAWEVFRYEFVIKGDSAAKEHTLQQLQELLSQIMTAERCEPVTNDCPPSRTTDCLETSCWIACVEGDDIVIRRK